ncbi:MAG: hypothetical protein KKA61_00250 [Nanoarchaeota archaeon]|nr:hypothetical protein [Nanoarchaeota archaeon]MBU4283754.1 hypothetical protein [Nanoarchaeota archaeon]MBU4492781.1 hypothetical protein [Nanoarchaeota archaeon]
MRSIKYVFKGKPQNLDDCLDFSRKETPQEVLLELITNEYVSDMYILNQFIGNCSWKFNNLTVNYKEIYGGCFYHEKEERQKLSVDNANKRLEDYLSRLEKLGIKVIGKEKRFDYSAVYRIKKKK